MNQKKSITIHNLDETLAQMIEQRAKEKGNSLNKTIKELLRKSLGISQDQKRADFSEFCGVWSEEDYKEFEENTKIFERIDPEDWK